MFDTPWQYEPAIDLDRTLADRLQSFPREPDMLVYGLRALGAVSLRASLKIFHRFSVRGRENLPQDGSFILVANHTSHLDALCLLSALPLGKLHRAFPAAAEDYFFVTLPRAAFSTVFINATPFGRKARARQSLDQCRRLLDHPGNILILFPEGTRSSDGAIGEFRPGVGSLIAGSDLPVVPCALRGAGKAWPKGSMLPHPRKIELVIGRPRVFSHLPATRESADEIATNLKSAVEELL